MTSSPEPKRLNSVELLEENREFAGIIIPAGSDPTNSGSASADSVPATIFPDSTTTTIEDNCTNPFHENTSNPFHSESSDYSDTNLIQPKNRKRNGNLSRIDYQSMTLTSIPDSPYDSDFVEHCHSIQDLETTKRQLQKSKSAQRRLFLACILVAVFITGEVIGGYISGSLAIMADAAHMFSDLASFGISLIAISVSKKRPRKRYNFGYHRAEVLGALFTVVLIWYVTGVLLYLAVHRLVSKEYEVQGRVMVIVAGCAVGFNILLGLLLHGCCQVPHSHSHGGHSHLRSRRSSISSDDDESDDFAVNSKKDDHINIRAALIHVLGDLLQSVGVLISSLIIEFKPEYKIADPICTIMFSVIVFCTTLTILRDTVNILMEAVPRGLDYDDVRDELLEVNGVVNVHDLKIWSVTMDKVALAAHVVTSSSELNAKVVKDVSKCLRKKYDIMRVTLQVETYSAQLLSSCSCCSQELD